MPFISRVLRVWESRRMVAVVLANLNFEDNMDLTIFFRLNGWPLHFC